MLPVTKIVFQMIPFGFKTLLFSFSTFQWARAHLTISAKLSALISRSVTQAC